MGVLSTQYSFCEPGRETSSGRRDSLAVQASVLMIPVEGATGKCGFASTGVVQFEERVERSEE